MGFKFQISKRTKKQIKFEHSFKRTNNTLKLFKNGHVFYLLQCKNGFFNRSYEAYFSS